MEEKIIPQSFSNSFQLYNEKVDNFFQENYINKKYYSPNEILDPARHNAVIYLKRGYLRIYSTNMHGEELFNGFIPQHSILMTSPGVENLGKYSICNNYTEAIYASLNDYLTFLQSSSELILHQIHEAHYRRNFNDIPRYASLNQSACVKVYIYLYYLAKNFGEKTKDNSGKVIIQNAISAKDIANYFGLHPNNVITFINELKKQGIISKEKKDIIINDLNVLENEIIRKLR